jgi:hypothetical protein
MRRLTRLLIIGTLCFFVVLTLADELYAFTWEPAKGVGEWESANVAEIKTAEFVTLTASDPRGFTISIARSDLRAASMVKITTRSMDVGVSLGCALMSGERPVQYKEQNLVSGRTWRDYIFEFGDGQPLLDVDRITVVFKHASAADISLIRVNGPSAADFFVVHGLKHHEVNYVEPYKILGYSFTIWCYIFFGLSIAGIAAYQARKKKKYLFTLPAVLFLALFVACDLRSTYEQMFIMAETYRDFISPPLREKRFFWYDDMLAFGEFLGAELPSDAGDIYYFGDDDRFLYFSYLLYPRHLIHAKETAARYNIVYAPDNAALSGDQLIVDGRVIAAGGKAVLFSPTAFLYVR